MGTQNIKIKTNEEDTEDMELIADSIIRISDAFEKVNNSGLTRAAIIILLQNAIGAASIGRREIGLVLEYAPKLKEYFTKKITSK